MRRFRKEFGLKKARILRERLIPVSQGLKIGINRQPLVSGDGKQPRDSRCRSPPDFSLHGGFCKLNLQEVNNGI